MLRWQRWTTYVVLAGCGVSGLVYFALMDYVQLPPSRMKFWWIAHGVTSLVALMVIGAATSQHVLVAWRAHRGRWTGSGNLALLLCLAVTAVLLYYGLESWHDPMHWVHAIVGVIAVVAFPVHVLWGRTRPARRHP
jgi:hypothetical protein